MVERAETMRVLWAALVGVRDGDDSIVSGQVYQLAVHSDVPRKDTLSRGGGQSEYLHDEPNLLSRLIRRALKNLDGEMRREGYKFASREGVLLLVLCEAQWRPVKQRRKVKSRQGV